MLLELAFCAVTKHSTLFIMDWPLLQMMNDWSRHLWPTHVPRHRLISTGLGGRWRVGGAGLGVGWINVRKGVILATWWVCIGGVGEAQEWALNNPCNMVKTCMVESFGNRNLKATTPNVEIIFKKAELKNSLERTTLLQEAWKLFNK